MALLLIPPRVAWANPMYFNPLPMSLIPVFFIVEGIVIALMGKKALPYLSRLLISWFFITAITFAAMVFLIRLLAPLTGGASIVIGESAVFIAEAHIIYWILGQNHYVRNPENRMSLKRSYLTSFFANATSLLASVAAMYFATLGQHPME
jgi:hypothetical protein